nr:pseudouridine synthase [uncultured Acetobacteroides sp.]
MGIKASRRESENNKRLVYFLAYKPYGMLSQFSREGDKHTLADLGFNFPKDAYPVGRLDHDSEGLLLITNDKSLNSRLLNPKHHYKKTYLVQVDREITDDAIEQLRKGVTINVNGEYRTRPAIVNRVAEPDLPERVPPIRFRINVPTSWIEITITEGKNRQIRKMTAAVEFPTLRLVRSAIGPLVIDGMNPGNIKVLTEKEVSTLIDIQ